MRHQYMATMVEMILLTLSTSDAGNYLSELGVMLAGVPGPPCWKRP